MKTIHKFELYDHVLARKDGQTLQLPESAVILSVQLQQGTLCVWALVDTERPLKDRKFIMVGTGQPCDHLAASAIHVGTFQFLQGALVLHLFDCGPW